MSAQTMEAVFAPAEARERERVITETWGHLAPKQNKAYSGRVVYAVGIFGSDDLNPTVIVSDFKGLDSSPWFYDSLQDFIDELRGTRDEVKAGKPGCVYEWVGVFRNYIFAGKTRLILDANRKMKRGGK